jgi:hypothetical protein
MIVDIETMTDGPSYQELQDMMAAIPEAGVPYPFFAEPIDTIPLPFTITAVTITTEAGWVLTVGGVLAPHDYEPKPKSHDWVKEGF